MIASSEHYSILLLVAVIPIAAPWKLYRDVIRVIGYLSMTIVGDEYLPNFVTNLCILQFSSTGSHIGITFRGEDGQCPSPRGPSIIKVFTKPFDEA